MDLVLIFVEFKFFVLEKWKKKNFRLSCRQKGNGFSFNIC